ncbi:DEAD/DEAH box helicase [Glutamicibacter protophormiae]|uniref:DEAD/DEAH box helicase n=1 Tax=Glutamicibacter protophormiae TaxID=37930 RepID=UPI003333FBF6
MDNRGTKSSFDLGEGIFESLITDHLAEQLETLNGYKRSVEPVAVESAPGELARFLGNAIEARLNTLDLEPMIQLTNKILDLIGHSEDVLPGPQKLMELQRENEIRARVFKRPQIPLSSAALLTNSREDPKLAAELRAELSSADRVDLLCAFIKWEGLRLLSESLQALKDQDVPIRVITTTYMGATQRHAIDELVRRFGAKVRINYETNATRLHAKAWMFHRNSGFDTAYVGSSNLSRPALLDGLEWNVRLSGVATPGLLQKFSLTFDSYWEDDAFVAYDPDTDTELLDAALARAGGTTAARMLGSTGLEVTPLLHQKDMLEELDAARTNRNEHRNLVIAATGTGKTVLAALDYKRLCEAAGRELALLFVAHRKEILEQSLKTYRKVLGKGSFGELFVDGQKPVAWKHVFASVQSLAALGLDKISSRAFEVVVIDEFHHAEASSYRKLIEHLEPVELLGLTATPERGDGINVADTYFDGRIASELRLWDALDADLLVPFHYFGVADDVDLSAIEWKRGSYDLEQLSNIYTGHDMRALKIINELRDKVLSTSTMRALGFCVSVQHAQYMAKVFNEAGIPSVAVSGSSSTAEREEALAKLRSRELNCIFAVDLFNEGLDVPEIDTILLLRPTQSSTIFLQQLGRGLRRADDKAVLTVLDFIGQQRREFRFDVKYRALLDVTRKNLERVIDDGAPGLPSGCQLMLDRVARSIVLDNIRSQLKLNKPALVREIKSYGLLELDEYLEASGRDVKDVYRKTGDSWTDLIRRAALVSGRSPWAETSGIIDSAQREEERELLKRVTRFLHVDDSERAEAYSELLSEDAPRYKQMSERKQVFARMLFFTFWDNGGGYASYDEGLDRIRAYGYLVQELRAAFARGVARSSHAPKGLPLGLQQIPIYSHATYWRSEVLAALEYGSLEQGKGVNHREGVAWCSQTSTDALFVTLNKDGAVHNPNTLYKDYAISPRLFHWESQNATSPTSPTGRRYLNRKAYGSHILLFTRDVAEEDGLVVPFTCLGNVDYVNHQGSKPIAITWKLQREMPVSVFTEANAVAR